MNKQHIRSIHAIQTNAAIINQIADQERQRGISQARKHAIESFYRSVVGHAHKLGLDVPHLSTFYQPEEYVAHCNTMLAQIEQKYGSKTLAKDGQERGRSCF